jgi:hypothetical protein
MKLYEGTKKARGLSRLLPTLKWGYAHYNVRLSDVVLTCGLGQGRLPSQTSAIIIIHASAGGSVRIQAAPYRGVLRGLLTLLAARRKQSETTSTGVGRLSSRLRKKSILARSVEHSETSEGESYLHKRSQR